MIRRNLGVLAVGVLVGLPTVLLTARLVAVLAYGVQPADPRVLAAGTTTVILLTLLGSLRPARRAARIDPVTALRADG